MLSDSEVLAMRMSNLLLSRPGDSPAGIAQWFGALQAQDLASGKWSLGVRLPGATEADIDAALERGEVMRTWPMRGTIHLVHPRNAHWLLELTGVRALSGLQKRWEFLGLDRDTAYKAADVLGEQLQGRRMTRTQCLATLEEAGIHTGKGRSYHLLWHTAQIGVTCIGPNEGNEQTFVLLDEWAPNPLRPTREEALALLARMYFQSHGPTTRTDFQGWTGLTATDCKAAIAGADLSQAGDLFYVPGEPADLPTALLLPGFDEYLLGFKDRRVFMAPDHMQAVVPGSNGMFKATAVHQGRVVGTWGRKNLTKRTVLTITALVPLSAKIRRAFESPAQGYGTYIGRDVEVVWT